MALLPSLAAGEVNLIESGPGGFRFSYHAGTTADTLRVQDRTYLRFTGEDHTFDAAAGEPLLPVEQVFFARNAASALKLGQARGAAICAALSLGAEVHEYTPKAVKQAVVGTGGAEKAQVQHMVRIILSLADELAEDQSDALAVAICHAHTLGVAPRTSWRPCEISSMAGSSAAWT